MSAGGPGSRSNTIIVGRFDVLRQRQRRVQLDVGEVGQPHERRHVVREAEVDVALVVPAPDARGLDPVRAVRRALLLVEELSLDAVRVALQRQRAVVQVRQEHGRDAHVVVDQVALREAGLRIHDLVEVGEPQRAGPRPSPRPPCDRAPSQARASRWSRRCPSRLPRRALARPRSPGPARSSPAPRRPGPCRRDGAAPRRWSTP